MLCVVVGQENAGHTVAMAMNGLDGYEAWRVARERSEPYDLILMDCNVCSLGVSRVALTAAPSPVLR